MTIRTSNPRPLWPAMIMGALGLWLGGSVVLDCVVMPSLYQAGMMTQPGFAVAGYQVFSAFNHLELCLAALVLSGVLALLQDRRRGLWVGLAALGLLAIALVYAYGLTPAMAGLGLDLHWVEADAGRPAAMDWLHGSYFSLEVLKISVGLVLIKWLATVPQPSPASPH
ncbi:MAG: DUF4149 domain-containing protein [Gloeomargaritaceae cyanobacterium C42_A2020_066]|nr:DUF4149 domain-containing protein [Gloeomargaritaceae cyanobacterium C42_A2020_066]